MGEKKKTFWGFLHAEVRRKKRRREEEEGKRKKRRKRNPDMETMCLELVWKPYVYSLF